ncbi:MAG: hypothetical protein GAKPKEKM_00042 [Rhodocyclaceae bacterium]|nr:hypothetical protein [Rhodocyclaceae bacterium]
MPLQLQNIFSREGMRRRKVKEDAFIDLFPRPIQKAGEGRAAGSGEEACELARDQVKVGAGQTYDANTTAPRSGGNSGNQISGSFVCHPR